MLELFSLLGHHHRACRFRGDIRHTFRDKKRSFYPSLVRQSYYAALQIKLTVFASTLALQRDLGRNESSEVTRFTCGFFSCLASVLFSWGLWGAF